MIGMKAPVVSRLAWAAFGLIALLYLGGLLFSILSRSVDVLLVVYFLFPGVGALVASRQPGNAIGWILLGIGFSWSLYALLNGYAVYALKTNPGSLPGADLVLAFNSWTWIPAVGLMGTFLLLLFPNGRLPSPGWRALGWAAAITMAVSSIATVITPGPFANSGFPNVTNPLGIEAIAPVIGAVNFLAIVSLLACIVGSTASAIQRFRRSHGIEHLQLKWLAGGAATTAVAYLIVMASSAVVHFSHVETTPAWANVIEDVGLGSFVLIPVAIGIAIFKYRLYDIDLIINKALVYGALAAFITGIYVGIVVGVGRLVGQSDHPNIALSIAATAMVAVAFQPVHARVQRFANRLVYGKRATPYEVLSNFAERVAGTYGQEEVPERIVATLADATGAARAQLWLNVGDRMVLSASQPPTEPGAHVAVPQDQALSIPGTDVTVAVQHQGELLGALAITKSGGEAVTPADRDLLVDLASQTGVVLRNITLTAELEARLDEISHQAVDLADSRRRIVATQDRERRKLERNLHDGAQQHLVALAVKLRLVKTLAERDPARAEQMLDQLRDELRTALETLRDLGRGVYPRTLTEQGLESALREQAERSPVATTVQADGLRRQPLEIEAALYFCILEALQNISKYSGARSAAVRVEKQNGAVVFSVSDDGAGFDASSAPRGSGLSNMADRIEALGGELAVHSAPGRGTTVTGKVPAAMPSGVGSAP